MSVPEAELSDCSEGLDTCVFVKSSHDVCFMRYTHCVFYILLKNTGALSFDPYPPAGLVNMLIL